MGEATCINAEAAILALGVAEAEQLYLSNKIYPPIQKEAFEWTTRQCSDRWKIVQWINGKDAVLNAQKLGLGEEVMYGILAVDKTNPSLFTAFIRGTESVIEWAEDVEFLLVDNDEMGSSVEDGFFSVFSSLTIEDIPLRDWVRQNLLKIDNVRITIACHSLGSAIGCYSAALISKDAIELKQAPVRLMAFACPKPGDIKLAAFMADHIASNSRVYNYERDVVPKLPPFDDFSNPPNVVILKVNPAVDIPDNPISNHLLAAYEALLDPAFIPALNSANIMDVFENKKLTLQSVRSFFVSALNALKTFF